MTSQLVRAVKSGLDQCRLDFDQIHKEAGVSRSTLDKIAAGSVKNPTALNLERLYLCLVRRGHLSATFEFEDAA